MSKILFDFNDSTVCTRVSIPWNPTPLPEGTPIDSSGNVANDGTAIGITYNGGANPYWFHSGDYAIVNVMTAGYIDLAEAQASSGLTYADAMMSKLENIRFVGPDGIPTGGGGLPEIEAGDDGKVLTVDDGEAVWAEASGGGVAISTIYYKYGTESIDQTNPTDLYATVEDATAETNPLTEAAVDAMVANSLVKIVSTTGSPIVIPSIYMSHTFNVMLNMGGSTVTVFFAGIVE